jgi:voltage-gated potassium channel
MLADLSDRLSRGALWGLRQPPREEVRARAVERRWRWPVLLVLSATIPAFYAELLENARPLAATTAYGLAAAVTAIALLHAALRSRSVRRHLDNNPLDIVLVLGLTAAAWLPPSSVSTVALIFRLAVALMTLVRMVWAMQHLITRGGLAYMLLTAGAVLALCGIGFWWLEPKALNLADGLWLAFTTAATVGYGDIVPSTPASKIFSVFVVMLGYGVLSLVTAAIATKWVETEERMIEREILRDLHRQIDSLRQDIAGLRVELPARATQDRAPAGSPPASPPRSP